MNKAQIFTILGIVAALFVFYAFVKPMADKTASKVYKSYDPIKSRSY